MITAGRSALALSATLALLAGGCSSTTTPSQNTPPATSLKENFTGTIAAGEAAIHNFNVTLSNGTLNVIMTAAGPPATIAMGLALGQPTEGSCALYPNAQVITSAGTLPQLSVVANAGAYCVAVVDVGNVTTPITYAVTVSHY